MKRHQPLLLYEDILIQVLPFTDGSDWSHLEQTSTVCHSICASSLHYIVSSWTSSGFGIVPPSLHSLLLQKELFKIYVYLADNPSYEAVDENHRSLLDLAVELKYYHFARILISKGIKSCTESETMFECIRDHDVMGCEILLSCGLPIDRFRSRDDGLNVLTSSVLFGSSDLVDLFLSKGVSVPNGILIEAIQSRGTHIEVIKIVSLLLNKGRCDPNSVSMSGVPALQVAILFSPFAHQLAEVLLSTGADPNMSDGSDGGGMTALDVASMKRKRTCTDLIKSVGGTHSFKFCVQYGQVVNFPASTDENTLKYLLSLAAAMGRVESLKALVELRTVDLDTVLVRGDISLLHLAACRGHYAVCRYLIRGCRINVSARAFGGVDIHMYAANLAGSPLWFNPAEEGLAGSLLPPVVRLKTAAELAREAGHDRLGKLLDFSVVESVIARRDGSSESSSWASSPRSSPDWSRESSPSGFVLNGF